jgi:type VI secretion system protein ImpK
MAVAGRPATMQIGARDAHVLVNAFCAFHAEVLAHKRQVIATEGTTPFDAIQQRLLDAFESQATRIGNKLPDHERRLFEEIRYVMIAMADEVFSYLEWGGQSAWVDQPLEVIVFQTRNAGERIFNRIEKILADRAAPAQLVTVYMTALALGFRGRYASIDTEAPEAYRVRLAEHLGRTDPDLLRNTELCPRAHASTSAGERPDFLPSLSRGLLPFALVIVGWIVLGEILWLYYTSQLSEVLNQILDAS